LKLTRANLPALLLLCVSPIGAGCSASSGREAPQAKPAGPPIEFLGAWGAKGNGPGLLDQPRSIATDDFAAVYLADAGAPDRFINKFTRGGHPLQSFEPNTQIKNPCAGAVDHGGAIYVLECGAGVLYLFSPEGKFIHAIRGGITASAKPSSVAVDYGGRIYIAESGAKKVLTYTPQGHLLGALGATKSTPNNFIGADQIAAGPEGGVYVSDSARHWIARISSDGSVQNSWTWVPSGTASSSDTSITAKSPSNPTCYLTVTQKFVVLFEGPPASAAIHVFALDGQELRYALLQDVDPSLTNISLGGVASTPDGEIVLLDTGAPRVLRFRLNLQ
jgi:sugar lactone lactonase YvrE